MSQHLKGWNKQKEAFTTQTADGCHPDQQVQEFGPGLRGAALRDLLDPRLRGAAVRYGGAQQKRVS
jgi:hypothetical protein